jgi:vanillate/3-O-methylgallate O-demethylase
LTDDQTEASVANPICDWLPAVFGDDPQMKKYWEYIHSKGIHTGLIKMETSGNYSSDPAVHQRTPYDLGWEKYVDLSPGHEFIGRRALERIAANPPNKWVELEWNSEDVIDVYASLFREGEGSYDCMEMPRIMPMVASGVYLNGEIIGTAVSRTYSYYFKKMISHAILSTEHAILETEVLVKWGSGENGPQKMIRAVSPRIYFFFLVVHVD